jgi:hypothetical protein
MASEPNWEKWRRMEAAEIWQFVALLDRLDPDSIVTEQSYMFSLQFWNASQRFHDIRKIAESAVEAGTLRCLSIGLWDCTSMVLMSEFLRWAQSREFPIPPELKPPAATGSASTGAAASSQIKGVKAFREFCEARGLVLNSDRAAYAFMDKADIEPIDGHAKKGRRIWDAAAIEPKVNAESERRKTWPKKRPK